MTPADVVIAFDPLCGWCYGFHPAIDAVRDHQPDLILDLRLGGLVMGNRIRPYRDLRGYIEGAAARLETTTGRRPSDRFFEHILDAPPSVLASSLPPSIAILAVRDADPDRAIDFAHAVQVAHFEEGADLNEPETYLPILDRLGLDVTLPDLGNGYDAPEAVFAHVQQTRKLGGNSFPTVWARAGDDALLPLPTTYDPTRFVQLVAEARQERS